MPGDDEVIDTTTRDFTQHFKGFTNAPTLEQIRQAVREEVHKALHPEETKPSATVEVGIYGNLYRGTVYRVEEDDED